MKSLASQTVRSNCCSRSEQLWTALVSDLDLFMSRANVNVTFKFACLKPKFIWVDLRSLFLIYLIQCDTGAPVWTRCYYPMPWAFLKPRLGLQLRLPMFEPPLSAKKYIGNVYSLRFHYLHSTWSPSQSQRWSLKQLTPERGPKSWPAH